MPAAQALIYFCARRQSVLTAMSSNIISYNAVLCFNDLLIRLVIVSQHVLMSLIGKNLTKGVGMRSRSECRKGYETPTFPSYFGFLVNPAGQMSRSTGKIKYCSAERYAEVFPYRSSGWWETVCHFQPTDVSPIGVTSPLFPAVLRRAFAHRKMCIGN